MNSIELTLEQPSRHEGASDAADTPGERKAEAFTHHFAEHLSRVGAERAPDSEFVPAMGDGVREDAVDADAGQEERGGGERGGQGNRESPRGPCRFDIVGQRPHIVDRQPWI